MRFPERLRGGLAPFIVADAVASMTGYDFIRAWYMNQTVSLFYGILFSPVAGADCLVAVDQGQMRRDAF